MTTRQLRGAAAAALLLSACGAPTPDAAGTQPAGDLAAANDAQQVWWQNVQALCGQAFGGEMLRFDPAMDEGWLNRPVIMHVRECSENEIRIPLHVGDNRSRTWVLTRTADGIRLKHDHRHEDGTDEESTMYGGDTVAQGAETRQEFPADDHSRALFERRDHPDGVHNVWAMEVHPGEHFTYELRRFNRDFAARFDLSRPVDAPPAPWGAGA